MLKEFWHKIIQLLHKGAGVSRTSDHVDLCWCAARDHIKALECVLVPVAALVQFGFILSFCNLSICDSTKEFRAAYANNMSWNWTRNNPYFVFVCCSATEEEMPKFLITGYCKHRANQRKDSFQPKWQDVSAATTWTPFKLIYLLFPSSWLTEQWQKSQGQKETFGARLYLCS